jgi:hypothetical protein
MTHPLSVVERFFRLEARTRSPIPMKLRFLTLTSLATVGLFASSVRSTIAGPDSHDVRSLRGAHGFTYSGSHSTLGAIASSGRIDFDGRGNARADFTTSIGGRAFTGSFFATYQVNANGTGSILIHLPWLNTQGHGNFVIVDHGERTYFTSTDAGYSVTGSTQRL